MTKTYLAGVAVLMFVLVSAAVPANAASVGNIPYVGGVAPTAYNSAIWSSALSFTGNQADINSTWWPVNGSITSDADLTSTVSLLWDNTNLYVKVAVTADDVHYEGKALNGNYWDNDSIEFYIDADNSKGTGNLTHPDTQDVAEYKGGVIGVGQPGSGPGSLIGTTASQFNGTISGNLYTIMGTWNWQGTGNGQLHLTSIPIGNQLIGFGLGVNDADENSQRQGEMMFWVNSSGLYNNASLFPTFTLTPEPATMALLAIGGLGMLVRRRRR